MTDYKPYLVRRERGCYNGKFTFEDVSFATEGEATSYYTASMQAEIELLTRTQGRPITNFYFYDRTQKKPFDACVTRRDVVERDMQSGDVVCHAYEAPKPIPMPKIDYPKPNWDGSWGVTAGVNRRHWGR